MKKTTKPGHEAIFNATATPTIITDPDLKVAKCNLAAKTLFASVVKNPVGKQLHELLEQIGKCSASFGKKTLQAKSESIELKLDNNKWLEATAEPIKSEEEVIGAVIIVRDITDKKLLEQEKGVALLNLAHAQKVDCIGRLTAGVAHDFSNILTTVIGYAELIAEHEKKSGSNDSLAKESADEIIAAGRRGSSLIRSIMAFSRKGEGKKSIFDINETIQGCSKMLSRLIPENIDLAISIDSQELTIKGDEMQLWQVLANLVTNARDAMPAGGQVTITTKAMVSNIVRITVKDTGTGIKTEDLDKIFEPFFTSKAQGKGTGLGLSIVNDIIKTHGGQIIASSTVGQGTTFEIFLPLAMPAEDEAREKEPAPTAEPKTKIDETILLLEDNSSLREMLTKILTNRGYKVISADDGTSGLKAFIANLNDVDLLLSDLTMPNIDRKSVV